MMQEQEGGHRGEGRSGPGARPPTPVSSVGEDRAILLGFTMMAFSVLMFFMVGVTTVKPYINSCWRREVGCVLLQTQVLEEEVDCRGAAVPCLRATVNLTGSKKEAFLHYDEDTVFLSKECEMELKVIQNELENIKDYLDDAQGNSSSCFSREEPDPEHVILHRSYSLRRALLALLWPCLLLSGGAVLVGLVKLSQSLSRLACSGAKHSQGKVSRRSGPLHPS